VFDVYNHFSQVSGLYLNVDKTEILCLSPVSKVDRINIVNDFSDVNIECVNKLKICGITFARDSEIEEKENVTDKIDKIELALKQWSKRNLSIFGRNLILKTFGLSQVLYSMQNSFFSASALKRIRTICFNFLWNKKSDKSKAYERVSRKVLYKPKSDDGINAPNIDNINKALKVKQLVRSMSPNNRHSISKIQADLIGPLSISCCSSTRSNFINDALIFTRELGKLTMLEVVNSNDGLKLHKSYYDLIGSSGIADLIKNSCRNLIALNFAAKILQDLGIYNIKQLVNEYKFPSSESHKQLISFIFQTEKSILGKLVSRKVIDDDISLLDCIPIGCNRVINTTGVKTRMLTNRFNLGIQACVSIDECENPTKLIYGLHPKENEVIWLEKHNAILSSAKLFKLKLVDSPLCSVCNVIQDSEHIFYVCPNAVLAWNVAAEIINDNLSSDILRNGSRIKKNNEVILAVKRTLLLNKNTKLDKKVLVFIIKNRLGDITALLKRKEKIKVSNRNKKLIMDRVV